LLILDLWDISFHARVVFGLGKNLLFKSILGRCVELQCAWWGLPNSIKDQQRGLNQVKQTFGNKARWATSAANHQKTAHGLRAKTKFSNRRSSKK
jgi:hypothetical protein